MCENEIFDSEPFGEKLNLAELFRRETEEGRRVRIRQDFDNEICHALNITRKEFQSGLLRRILQEQAMQCYGPLLEMGEEQPLKTLIFMTADDKKQFIPDLNEDTAKISNKRTANTYLRLYGAARELSGKHLIIMALYESGFSARDVKSRFECIGIGTSIDNVDAIFLAAARHMHRHLRTGCDIEKKGAPLGQSPEILPSR